MSNELDELPQTAEEAVRRGFVKVDLSSDSDFPIEILSQLRRGVSPDELGVAAGIVRRRCSEVGRGNLCYASNPDRNGKRMLCYCSDGVRCDDCYRG